MEELLNQELPPEALVPGSSSDNKLCSTCPISVETSGCSVNSVPSKLITPFYDCRYVILTWFRKFNL